MKPLCKYQVDVFCQQRKLQYIRKTLGAQSEANAGTTGIVGGSLALLCLRWRRNAEACPVVEAGKVPRQQYSSY